MLIVLFVKWFFHCVKAVWKGETLHGNPSGGGYMSDHARFKMAVLMREGRSLHERACAMCHRRMWTSVDSPICNQLMCYVRWHRNGKSKESKEVEHVQTSS